MSGRVPACAGLVALLASLNVAAQDEGDRPRSGPASLHVGYGAQPDRIGEPGRIGYSSADGKDGAQLHFGVQYKPGQAVLGGLQWEPYVGLSLADEPARKLDRKDIEIGARAIAPFGYADMAVLVGTDRRSGATRDGAWLRALVTPERFGGFWRRVHDAGVSVRPQAGMYVERLRHSDDPLAAPDGRASGVWAGLGLEYATARLPRDSMGYRNRFVRDVSVGGARMRERHRFHAFHYTHLFYDPNVEGRAGVPRISLTIERAIGSDPIDDSRERHATTGG